MSQFVDKLKRTSIIGPTMGFHTAARSPSQPRMLVVALVEAGSGRLKKIAAGADAGLLSVADLITGAKAIKQASRAVPDIPWGGWLEGTGGEGFGKLGADFIVFAASSPLFGEVKMGRVLEVEPSMEASLLKAADDLPVDAVLIAIGDGPLAWRDLMLFQRCASILNKPVLALVSSVVTASELGALWEAGVAGVVVRAGVEGGIAGIRQMIDKLPPLAAKQKKAQPLLPRTSGEAGMAEEEEEEEEE